MLLVLLLVGACEVLRPPGPVRVRLPATTASALPSLPSSEGELHLLMAAWPPFDATALGDAVGCSVTVHRVRTSYNLRTRLHEGGIDVALVPTDITRILIRDDVLQPINPDLLSHWEDLDPELRAAPWNAFEDAPWGVPFQWGPHGLLSSNQAFVAPPDTWRVLYENEPTADGRTTKGHIQTYESPIVLAQAALLLQATLPSLGITNPYALSKDQFRATTKLTRRQQPNVASYWQDPDQQVADFLGPYPPLLASSWRYQARALERAGADISWSIPGEGATAWGLTAMLPRDAAHPGCAYRWIDEASTRASQAAIAVAMASIPARRDACGTAPLTPEQCADHGVSDEGRLYPWQTPERLCEEHTECIAFHQWFDQYMLARAKL